MPIQAHKLQFDRQQGIPLARQLYMQLHQHILHGDVTHHERLPATRQLAKELQLARNVVVEAYDMLKTDGLVAGFGKGGTRVNYPSLSPPDRHRKAARNSPRLPLSQRGQQMACARNYRTESALPLTPGIPDMRLFPYAQWQRLSKEALHSAPSWYQRTGGLSLLKRNLQNFLAHYRGIHIRDPKQLLITTGTQASLSLLAQLLANPGECGLIEQPGWGGAAAALKQAGLNIQYIPVDAEGAQLPKAQAANKTNAPKFIVITPGVQFPTGRPMSMARREAFLEYSARHKAWLIEDDFATEYSYAQHPPPSLLAHSNNQHVIHTGTLSKLMMPGLRLGWMVVPEHIADAVNRTLNTLGLQPAYLLQQQLALFIQYGYLSSHLANTRAIYNERRRSCSAYLQACLTDTLSIMPSISGMTHYLHINPDTVAVDKLPQQLQLAGLGAEIFRHPDEQKKGCHLLLGHAAGTAAETQAALHQLSAALTG